MRVVSTAANLAWWAASLPEHARFRSALCDPRRAQLALLRRYVRINAGTLFGREHRFEEIDSIHAFRRRVPVRGYDEIVHWIDRICAGEPRVLTHEPVTRLVPSSGSTRAAKLIPYTRGFHAELNRAIGPWIADLYHRNPSLVGGCAYWSVTPVVQKPIASPSAVPIGFDEDSAYLGGVRKRLLDAVLAVPGDVRLIPDMDEFRRVTLSHLLSRRDLRLISVWHPSFLELLLDFAEAQWEQVLDRVSRPEPGRARELRRLGSGNWRAIWPHLRLVSCWADAHAAGPAESLRRRLPRVQLQPKGLIATEAVLSIPFGGFWPLAIRSHFLEFEDDSGGICGSDQLRVGGEYGVIVTTVAGLWRYRLGDRVRCERLLGRTPSIRFVGRDDLVVDRRGEKLSERFVGIVIRAWAAAMGVTARFAMLAPDGETPPRYTLFLESTDVLPTDAAAQLDLRLSENPHYAYCRRLGQLRQARVMRVVGDAYAAYARHESARNKRIGDLKPPALDSGADWMRVFHHNMGCPERNGRYVEAK